MQGLRCVSSLPHDGPPVLDSHSQKRPDGYSELGRQGVPVGIAVEDGHDLGDDNPRPAERIHRGSRRPSGVQDIVHNRHPLARPQCRDVHHRFGVPCALPGAGEIAASGLQLPLTTFGLYVSENPSPETPPDGAYRLLIETEASSSRFALPAELFLRMAFPGQSVTREDAHFFVETEISREQAALAVLSMFLLPYMGM